MSDEQLRIAVAEACGWTRNEKFDDLWYHADSPHCQDGQYCDEDDLPNYPASLDACASFEATLTKEQRFPYRRSLCQQVGGCSTNLKSFEQITSTARQRCLAYLATVRPPN